MGVRTGLGEFEQLVLLAVLQLKDRAYGPEIAGLLEDAANRDVSRGALYSSLERLERKGFLHWKIDPSGKTVKGNVMRRFSVTPRGVQALRVYREALLTLWSGLEDTLAPGTGRGRRA
jgi:DNA-binding PadR family transcriptional regulator